MAVAHAKGRYGQQSGKVVRFDIPDSEFATLNVMSVSLLRVCSTWLQLKMIGRTHTYQFEVDVVYGPICVAPNNTQHKFESLSAEKMLNDQSVRSVL